MRPRGLQSPIRVTSKSAWPTRLKLDAINVRMLPQVSERGFDKTTHGISLIIWIVRV